LRLKIIFSTKWIFKKSETNITKKKSDFLVEKIDFFQKKISNKRSLNLVVNPPSKEKIWW